MSRTEWELRIGDGLLRLLVLIFCRKTRQGMVETDRLLCRVPVSSNDDRVNAVHASVEVNTEEGIEWVVDFAEFAWLVVAVLGPSGRSQ